MPPCPSSSSTTQPPRMAPTSSSLTGVCVTHSPTSAMPRRIIPPGAGLASHECQHRLPDLNLVAFLQHLLGDALAVHVRAIGAAFVTHEETPGLVAADAGMQARDRQVFEEDVALTAAADGEPVFADLEDAARLFALADDDHPRALLAAGGASDARLVIPVRRAVVLRHTPAHCSGRGAPILPHLPHLRALHAAAPAAGIAAGHASASSP